MAAKEIVLAVAGLPLLPIYWSSDRDTVRADAARWVQITESGRDAIDAPPTHWIHVLRMAARYPEFRSLLYRRANKSSLGKALSRLASVFYRGAPGLIIGSGPIGPGLYIEHGFSSVLAHTSLGRDVWINQNVTLAAHGERGGPVIGDRVRIYAGAVVLGGVHVADETIVGAGSVVSRDTTESSVVAGNPARYIKPRSGDGRRLNES